MKVNAKNVVTRKSACIMKHTMVQQFTSLELEMHVMEMAEHVPTNKTITFFME